MAIEAALETNVGESKEESTPTVVWSPGTGVSEEQTRVAQEMVLKTQWRVQLVNERWQLAKLCLFDKVETPDKLRVHAFHNAVIVSPSIQPGKLVTTIRDGNCFFFLHLVRTFQEPKLLQVSSPLHCQTSEGNVELKRSSA